MPRFATISPTHHKGKKPEAWEHFRDGNYIALGWKHQDYTGWPIEDVIKDLKKGQFGNEREAIDAHRKFFELEVGDVVGVNNVNKGFYGIGLVTSDYRFAKFKHPTGHTDRNEHYSHYREVRWLIVDFVKRQDLSRQGERYWEPRGTLGVRETLPGYILGLFNQRGITISNNSVDWGGDSELVGYEGRIREELRLHKWVERDRDFIRRVRTKLAWVTGCMGCSLDPVKAFGLHPDRFFQAHHIRPLALRKSERVSVTRESDIALLCPNCHTRIHRMMVDEGKTSIPVGALKAKTRGLPTRYPSHA